MINVKTLLILGGAITLQQYLGGGFNGIQQAMIQGQANRAARTEQQRQTDKLKLSADANKDKAAIAAQRYRDGCVMVVGHNNRDKFAVLVEGQPVLNNTDDNPLPVGTIVCDAIGMTAQIIRSDKGIPVVGDMAFTSDRALVAEAAKRYPGASFNTNSTSK